METKDERRTRILEELKGMGNGKRLGSFGRPDPESDHADADDLLLELIDDQEVTDAFNAIRKWYA